MKTPKSVILPNVSEIKSGPIREVFENILKVLEENHNFYYEDLVLRIITLIDGDTTPDVKDGTVFKTANTGATSITTFDNGTAGQMITIMFGDTNTSIVETDNIVLKSALAASVVNEQIIFSYDGTNWREVIRTIDASEIHIQDTDSIIKDTDGDTKVDTEESTDEDKVRIDTGGTERALFSGTCTETYANINKHSDLDGDTFIQVEESADEDTIRIDAAGTEIATYAAGLICFNPAGTSTQDFVFGSPQLDDDEDADHYERFFFDKSKGAFRAGFVTNTNWDAANVGDYSFACGWNTKASGGYSFAEGYNTTASAGHAEGYSTTSSGSGAHAEGDSTTASGENGSHAEGHGTTASGNASHAEGGFTTASNTYAHAEGRYTTASGDDTHAEGYYTEATGGVGHAEGIYSKAYLRSQHAKASGRFSTSGDAQYSNIVVRNQTTDATQTTLLFGESEDQNLILATNTTWVFHIFVNGRQTSADTTGIGNYGDSAGYEFKGVIRRRQTQAEAVGDTAVYTAVAGDKLKIIIDGSQTFDDIDMEGDASIDDAVASINAVTDFSTYAIAYKDGDGYLRIKSFNKTSDSRVQVADGTGGNGGECEDLFSGASVDVSSVDSTALVGSLTKTVLAEDDADWDATVEADDTNEALAVKVTGEVDKDINWVACVNLVECGG